MAISEVKRLGPQFVDVNFTVSNLGDHAVAVPELEIPDSPRVHSLRVLHFDDQRGWGSLGPFVDIPADTAITLEPQKTLSFVHHLHDPSIVVWPGLPKPMTRHELKPAPLGGKYKIVIGYYASMSEWYEHRRLRNGSTKQAPQVQFVESDEFTIDPAK